MKDVSSKTKSMFLTQHHEQNLVLIKRHGI